jgi:hypothetical protein
LGCRENLIMRDPARCREANDWQRYRHDGDVHRRRLRVDARGSLIALGGGCHLSAGYGSCFFAVAASTALGVCLPFVTRHEHQPDSTSTTASCA